METTCSLDRALHSSALGSINCYKPLYSSPQTTANYHRRRNEYVSPPNAFHSSLYNNFSSSSTSSQRSSLASFGKHFLSPLGLRSADHHYPNLIGALNVSSQCLAMTERGSAPSIRTSSGTFSWVRCKCITSEAGCRTPNCSLSLTGTMFANGELRKIRNSFVGNSRPPCSRAMITLRFPSQLGSKSQSCTVTCLAHMFGAVDRCAAEQRPRLFHVFSLRGKGKRRPHGVFHQLCGATGKSGTGQPVPEEENPEPTSEQSPPPIPGKNSDLPVGSPVDSEAAEVDWRAFRARLVVTEHTTTSNDTGTSIDEENTGSMPVSSLGTRWAHPILAPEAGCILIATDKIDGMQGFERSVILLLSPGSSKPREGPYGLILNRPLSCRIKDIKPKDRILVKFFGNCQVHHGGPLDEDMFLLLHGTEGVKGYREVIPGVYYGSASGLEEIMKGKRPLDYRFFFGYSGWSVEQLKKEIDAGLWCVAACSTDLITGHSAAGLWEEILLLMGGKYGELSKRPRRRHF